MTTSPHRHPSLEPGQGFLNTRRKPRPGSPLRCVRDDDVLLTVIPAKAGTQLHKFQRHSGLEPGQGFLNTRRKPRPGSPLRYVRDDDK